MVQTPHWSGDPEVFVESLFNWMTVTDRFCRCGSDSLLSRALSVADRAMAEGATLNAVCAGLLHVVGNLLICTDFSCESGAVRNRSHEIGARWLSGMFPHTVSEPIRLLPDARRWLFATDSEFRKSLSDDAMRELAIMGGPMVESERLAFENRFCFQEAAALSKRIEGAQNTSCSHGTPNDLRSFRQQVIDCLISAVTFKTGTGRSPIRISRSYPAPETAVTARHR